MKEIKEGFVPFLEYQTYYRIVNPKGKKTPLLFLHGGPGSTHNSFEVFDDLAFFEDRPFVMYDQLGCGKSFVEGKDGLFCSSTWVKELENLRKELHLQDVHLIGHSWGGMLEIIYACDYKPKGVKSMILSSTLASAKIWREETHRLITFLSEEDQKAILRGEEEGKFTGKDFLSATEHYMHRFVSGPWTKSDPNCLTRERIRGKQAYEEAWGPCEYSPLGNLKDYEYLEKLSKITCPVLLLSGANDESTPYQNLEMFHALQCKKNWVMFAKSRHMSYYEEKEKYQETISTFLNEND